MTVAAGSAVQQRMDAVSRLLRGHRYVYASEAELQQQLADVLTRAGLPARREVALSARDRIDILAGDVGIEVKVKGRRTPLAQLTRYSTHPRIGGLLLVTTRAASLPPLIGGKPAGIVSLITNGLA